jgi:hypothetical protein
MFSRYNLARLMMLSVGLRQSVAHPAILCRTVDGREVQLVVGSIQIEHQLEHHVANFFGTAIGLVYLIDDNDRFQSNLQSFLQVRNVSEA